MSERWWLVIHWSSLILVIILIFLTIARVIINTLFGPSLEAVSLRMIDETAIEIILYFLILPIFTITYWLVKDVWVFFPWQHSKAKR